MMIRLIAFSMTGYETGERLMQGLVSSGHQAELFAKSRYLPDSIQESTSAWAKKYFTDSEALIFIGACGIAVRSIAPCVVSKTKDPAVLVIDECGKYVISLLSGHLGGANALALEAAAILGAEPVVTTATDLHSRFAVDVFSRENQCAIFHMKAAKEISAALLAGEKVGFFSEFPWEGDLPEGLVQTNEEGVSEESGTRYSLGAAVTIHRKCLPFESTVQIVPKTVFLGMGCKKGTPFEKLRIMAEKALEQTGIFREAVSAITSIDLKKEEEGLLSLAEEWGIPFITYTKDELLELPGDFTSSGFVRSITGVDNVCERSAYLASSMGKFLLRKTAGDGTTAALAVMDWRATFE